MDKEITLTYLINLYYDICDNWTEYMPTECTPQEIVNNRTNIVFTIYNIIYCKFPVGGDSVSLIMLLNNDIKSERYTAEQIIEKLKIYL